MFSLFSVSNYIICNSLQFSWHMFIHSHNYVNVFFLYVCWTVLQGSRSLPTPPHNDAGESSSVTPHMVLHPSICEKHHSFMSHNLKAVVSSPKLWLRFSPGRRHFLQMARCSCAGVGKNKRGSGHRRYHQCGQPRARTWLLDSQKAETDNARFPSNPLLSIAWWILTCQCNGVF